MLLLWAKKDRHVQKRADPSPDIVDLLFHERYEILVSSAVQLGGIRGIRFLVQLTQIFVVVFADFLVVPRQHQYADAGALVRGTFKIGECFQKDDAGADGALSGFQPFDVAVA